MVTKKTLISIYTSIIAITLTTISIVHPASAVLDWQDEVDVQFTFNPALSVTISEGDIVIPNLGVGTRDDSNEITITVGTNNVAGYQLSATVGNNTTYDTRNLKHDTSATALFSSLDVGSSLAQLTTPSTWGYSTNSGTSYSGLPKYDDTNNVAILNDSNTSGTETTNFLIGAYADQSQLAGDYRNVINFNVVTNPVKDYMQDFTASQCQALATDAPYTVYDRRDGNDYTVRYLNGACWMTQNLRITGTISATDSNFTGSDFNPCTGDLTSGNSYDEPRCHDSGNKSNGVWYNYAAASAGQITTSNNTTLATEDICPENWSLPSYDTTNPAGSINSMVSSDSTAVSAFSPVGGGYYDRGSHINTSSGYWWSTTAYNYFHRYNLYSNGSSLSTYSTSRNLGHYIRCVRR